MTLYDWFDPYNYDHIRAYRHLMNTGSWPEGVIPSEIEMGSLWSVELTAKMANAWVDAMERGLIKNWNNPTPQHIMPVAGLGTTQG